MKATTLIILAGGMGTRFGGLKQIEPLSAEGETFIDFSLYDAKRCGIKRVVFVVRKDILEEFQSAFGAKQERFQEVLYVCQDKSGPPRGRPWGTGHAVLAAKTEARENFLVINADDFYGRPAFEMMTRVDVSSESADFALAGYELGDTLSDQGAVSRGECLVDDNGKLRKVLERKGILSDNGEINFNGGHRISPEAMVSMNFWFFTPRVFDLLEVRFERFANTAKAADEFYLNEALSDAVMRNEANIRVLKTESEWMGVTYREDKDRVASRLAQLKAEGIYPDRLWQ